MAAFDQGTLAKYNSLTDRHLMGYFSNDRMRNHLIRNGLITKTGEVVPDAVYRVKMARREHRRRVRDLIAQAIIHKALEMERSRQIDIRKKIEEIAKIELVRRVREDRTRLGDEDCLSYFSPGNMEVVPKSGKEKRTKSEADEYILPVTPEEKSRLRLRKLLPAEEIESKHLAQLDQLTLGEYSKILQKQDNQRINKLPYLGFGRGTARSKKSKVKKIKKKPKPVTDENIQEDLAQAEEKTLPTAMRPSFDAQEYVISNPKTNDISELRDVESSQILQINFSDDETDEIGNNFTQSETKPTKNINNSNFNNAKKNKNKINRKRKFKNQIVKSARSNQSKIQSLTKLSILFHSPTTNRSYEVMVEQQPSGGNTLILFRDTLTSNSVFTVVSQRHKGFPFSLTFYINNVKDSRISTCCEYKHKVGKRIGGPNGHFSLFSVEGANPCFRCLTERDMESENKKKSQTKNPVIPCQISMSNNISLSLLNTSYWVSSNCSQPLTAPIRNNTKTKLSNPFGKHCVRKHSGNFPSGSLRVLMPLVDFYTKSNEPDTTQHASISVDNDSESSNYSENEFESSPSSDESDTENEENEGSSNSSAKKDAKADKSEVEIEVRDRSDSEESPEVAVNDNEPTIEDNSDQLYFNKPAAEHYNNNAIENRNHSPENREIVVSSPSKNKRLSPISVGVTKITILPKEKERPLESNDSIVVEERLDENKVNTRLDIKEMDKIDGKTHKTDIDIKKIPKLEEKSEILSNDEEEKLVVDPKFRENGEIPIEDKTFHGSAKPEENSEIRIGKNTGENENVKHPKFDKNEEIHVGLPHVRDENEVHVHVDTNSAEKKVLNNPNFNEKAEIHIEKNQLTKLPKPIKEDEILIDGKVEENDKLPNTNLNRNAQIHVGKPNVNETDTDERISMDNAKLKENGAIHIEENKSAEMPKPKQKREIRIEENVNENKIIETPNLNRNTDKPGDANKFEVEKKLDTNHRENLELRGDLHIGTEKNHVFRNDSPENTKIIMTNNSEVNEDPREIQHETLLTFVSPNETSDESFEHSKIDNRHLIIVKPNDGGFNEEATVQSPAFEGEREINEENRSKNDYEDKENKKPLISPPPAMLIDKERNELAEINNEENGVNIGASSSNKRISIDKENIDVNRPVDSDSEIITAPTVQKIQIESNIHATNPMVSRTESRSPSVLSENTEGMESTSSLTSTTSNTVNKIKENSLVQLDDRNDLKIVLPVDDNESGMPSMSDRRDHDTAHQSEELPIDSGKFRNEIKHAEQQSSSSSSSSSEYETDSENHDSIKVDNQAEEPIISPIKPNDVSTSDGLRIFVENDDINFKRAKEMCQAFDGATIESITIRNSELPNYVFNFISDKLESHPELKSIELSGCEVEISLLNLLAKGLKMWPNLEQLILSDNQFMDYSLQNLIDMIKFLYHNDGNSDGHKQNLKLFDFSNCKIQGNDLMQLNELIARNPRLESLVLDGNPISLEMLKDICKALQKNRNTKVVSLVNCEITQSMLDNLDKEFDESVKRLKIIN